jgi:hypothetical protein
VHVLNDPFAQHDVERDKIAELLSTEPEVAFCKALSILVPTFRFQITGAGILLLSLA